MSKILVSCVPVGLLFYNTYTLKLALFTLAEQPPKGKNFKLVKHL